MFEGDEEALDLLSVIFLILLMIVVFAITTNLSSDPLLMAPAFGVMAGGVWAALDYVLLKRYRQKVQCLEQRLRENEARSGVTRRRTSGSSRGS